MGAFGAASMVFMYPDLPPIPFTAGVPGFVCGNSIWALILAVIKVSVRVKRL